MRNSSTSCSFASTTTGTFTDISAGVRTDASDVALAAKIGMLSVGVAGGTLNVDAELSLGLANPDRDPRGNITRAEIEGTSIADLVTLTPGVDTSLAAVLPLAVSVGSFQVAGDAASGPALAVDVPDLFGGAAPTVTTVGDVEDLLNFNSIVPADIIGALRQLGEWLGQLSGNSVLDVQLPFTGGTSIGDALDLAEALTERISGLSSDGTMSGQDVLVGTIDVVTDPDRVEFRFSLAKRAEVKGQPFAFDLGVPALGMTSSGTIHAGALYVAWQDMTSGNWEIYAARLALRQEELDRLWPFVGHARSLH